MELYVAHTDREWYDTLSTHAQGGTIDEVNFWFPRSQRPAKHFREGDPIFFRLGAPVRKIAGYGFFAFLNVVPVSLAWETFGYRNGANDRGTFYRLLGRTTPEDLALPVQCMVLLDARFWPDARWVPWDEERGYANTGVQMGRTEKDPKNVAVLLDAIRQDGATVPPELRTGFEPVLIDEREVAARSRVVREGQGAFRLRLLEAYGGCAITGEHTEPVLDAAHIQPYLGRSSNHPCNGLILTKEFHALFDKGLVTIEPQPGREEYRVRVSRLLRERWSNGRRYNAFDGQSLVALPADPRLRPSREALEWHRETIFEKVA